MVYCCMRCGNISSISATEGYTETGTRTVYLDENGNVSDYGDYDSDDSYGDGEYEDLECMDCGASDVEWFDDEEEMFEELENRGVEINESERPGVRNWRRRIETH